MQSGHGVMARRRIRLEADGITHRRDCECPRCDAGFTPSERERETAEKRRAAKQGRLSATRAAERRKEAARLKQLDLDAYFRQAHATVDAEVQRLRASRARVLADRRLDELLRLRDGGLSMEDALREVDRRFPPTSLLGADNDNAHADQALVAGAGAPEVGARGASALDDGATDADSATAPAATPAGPPPAKRPRRRGGGKRRGPGSGEGSGDLFR